MSDRIRVVARIRPNTRKEIGERTSITRLEDYTTLRVAGSTDDDLEEVRASVFRFDSVYNADDDQVTVYEEEVADVVDHCLGGSNGTIFAYGQTGSGKTHTILGKTGGDGGLHGDSGVFLRVFCDLFGLGIKHVMLSAVELYLDDVYDLLDGRAKRKVRDSGTEVVVAGMKELAVDSLADVLEVFQVAMSARSVTSTSMNDESSRSHAVFFITIPPQAPARPNPVRLMLVDLAGSERIKKSQAKGAAVAEAAAINASLSTLGTVVHAMYAGSAHIPFRDSKLTSVLKGTFSDKKCRVLLIGQFSPAASNSLESISTAKFCDRVKGLSCSAALSGPESSDADKALLAAQKANAELGAEMRVARASIGLATSVSNAASANAFSPASPAVTLPTAAATRRRSLKPSRCPPGARFELDLSTQQREADALREEILTAVRELQEEESRDAVRACEELTQRLFQSHVAKRVQSQNDLLLWQQKLSGVATAKAQQQHGAEAMEAEIAAKTTEAKRAKKRRVVAEEKLANELRPRRDAIMKELAVTPENYVLPPSKVNFDADDDPEAEAEEKRAEANHTIVSDFYHHWRAVSRMHKDAVATDDKIATAELDRRRLRGEAHSFFVWQFASDVVAFSWQRACDIAEGAIDPATESWAWPDVIGCNRFLVDAANWVPRPLVTLPEFAKQPVDNENLIRKTDLGEDAEPTSTLSTPTTAPTTAPVAAAVAGAATAAPAVITPTSTVTPQSAKPSAALPAFELDDDDESGKENVAAASRPAPPPAAASSASSASTSGDAAAAGGSGMASLSGLPSLVPQQQQQKDETAKDGAAAANGNSSGGSKASKNSKRKKTPEEMALAEKHYLMGIYDSKTLVADIYKFLQTGTKVIKHGRAGEPHRRHAWVRDRVLYWIDPDTTNAGRQRHSIPVSGIGRIVLGPFSKVFKRNPIPPTSPEFFLSFSVHLKDDSRSVDFVAENLVDFEAWVIGLVNLTQIDAHWGKPLPCAQMEPADYAQLTAPEKALCDTENILPSTFNRVRSKIIEIRDDIAMHMRAFRGNSEQAFHTMGGGIHMPDMDAATGAVLITKGELRYHTSPNNVDIFRCCKIFEHFRGAGMLYDPEYVPICKFGTTSK